MSTQITRSTSTREILKKRNPFTNQIHYDSQRRIIFNLGAHTHMFIPEGWDVHIKSPTHPPDVTTSNLFHRMGIQKFGMIHRGVFSLAHQTFYEIHYRRMK